MASAGQVYVLGLETYNNNVRLQPTEKIAAAIAANSSLPAERVAKYCMATQVETGSSATDPTQEGLHECMVMSLDDRYTKAKMIAIEIATETVGELLKTTGIAKERITHIVTCTCTALFNPGLETMIPNAFGLRNDIFSLGLNFMGCHAGVKTLAAASALAKANPGSRVLFVCCEICSLFVPPKMDTAMDVLAAALFRDGCAAGIVGTDPQPGETPLLQVGGRTSLRIPDTLDQMKWDMKEERAYLYIGKEIPETMRAGLPAIREHIPDFNDCRVAMHPGGPAILEAAAAALSVPKDDMKHAFGVLKRKGNMSSSCIFYVLQSMLKEMDAQKVAAEQAGEAKKVPDVIMMAFGPGLTTECVRLHPVSSVA